MRKAADGKAVVVYGAGGHTARFVISLLERRGWRVILAGREGASLQALGRSRGAEVRIADSRDRQALDRALEGAFAVLNCAGPFLDTGQAIVEAALRSRVHYIDVTAEQPAALAVFEHYGEAAREAGIVILPAMGFFGGLADLLATAAMGGWASADEIEVAVGLDSWKPTRGTRLTGQRNSAPRSVWSGNRFEELGDAPGARSWDFGSPLGPQDMIELPLSEIVTISHHLRVPEIRSYMNRIPLVDLRDPSTPPPQPVDPEGRSDQIFMMDVVVRRGDESRRAAAQGRDIYAVTAPLMVEALERVAAPDFRAVGVRAPGEVFDAESFLNAMSGAGSLHFTSPQPYRPRLVSPAAA